ncbi:MAG: DUF6582 domain-containing protein [Dermatophilaceae bacterium]
MAELSGAARDRLEDADFAYIDTGGGRHLPIHDEDHVRNAAARFSQTDFESTAAKKLAAQAIARAADKHGVDLNAQDEVVKAAKD